MGGRKLADCVVVCVAISEQAGFSIGRIRLACATGATFDIVVCNEFMAVTEGLRTLVAFPDLIVLLDRQTGLSLAASEVQVRAQVVALIVPGRNLRLGATMRDRRLLHHMKQHVAIIAMAAFRDRQP